MNQYQKCPRCGEVSRVAGLYDDTPPPWVKAVPCRVRCWKCKKFFIPTVKGANDDDVPTLPEEEG